MNDEIKKNQKLNSLCDFEEYEIPDRNQFDPSTHIDLKKISIIISLLGALISFVWNTQQEEVGQREAVRDLFEISMKRRSYDLSGISVGNVSHSPWGYTIQIQSDSAQQRNILEKAVVELMTLYGSNLEQGQQVLLEVSEKSKALQETAQNSTSLWYTTLIRENYDNTLRLDSIRSNLP